MNIENVFIGNPIQKGDQDNTRKKMSDEFVISNVLNNFNTRASFEYKRNIIVY